ncbi:nitrogen regulation protein NR(II) [Thermopetrobacter sp. TC1]|uniref:two-component system sensor histidine kinase NtrB n=1 Tax=Thermopetrobacter sp. TC1 TaxID=1495045 RepID=UPI0009DF5CAA|nr:ATP-binding protein [Thermopetrobacter sp. TC1]
MTQTPLMKDGEDDAVLRMRSALLMAIPNPLIAIDAENTILFVNAAAENFFQASARTLRKYGLESIIPFTSPLFELIESVRRTGATINEYEVSIGTPRTGGERAVDLQAGIVPELPGVVVLQIWPRSMAQKIDRQLTYRGAARTVSGMAAMLAHEIKNPLSGIRGAAQLLEPSLPEEDRALTQLICAEADRIRNLVDQMEVFTDERPLQREAVNIHTVLDHVKKLAESGFAAGIPIQEYYDPSLPPVLGNRDQLIQVFLNLVKNAAEAVRADDRPGGHIDLTTAFRPGVRIAVPGSRQKVSLPLEVKVRNTGRPVPDEIRPHIFDPFVTTKPSSKGLGLALVAKIVRDHGGVVEFTSDERFTTFRVLLPIYDEDAA